MKWQRRSRRPISKLNTSSIADIAFLALVFFLLTSAKPEEKGFPMKLQPYTYCGMIDYVEIKKRNVLFVTVKERNQLFVNERPASPLHLAEVTRLFITNPHQDSTLAKSPKKALVQFSYQKETSYDTFIQIYNELKRAYHEIWEEEALIRYGFHYKSLDNDKKRAIHRDFPLVISEVEPRPYYY